MNRSFLRVIGIALAATIIMAVTVSFGADYLIIKKKDGSTQKVPLDFPAGQIEEFDVQSVPQEVDVPRQPPLRPRHEQEIRERESETEEKPSPTPFIFREGPARPPSQQVISPRGPEREPARQPRGPVAATAPISKGTLSVNLYKLPEGIKALPDFSALKPAEVLTTDVINLHPQGSKQEPTGLPQDVSNLGMRFVGMFVVSGEGIFKWRLHAKDGARMHVDDKTIIEIDGIHEPLSKSGFVHLAEGVHSIVIDSFNSSGAPVLQLYVQSPLGEEQLFSVSKGLIGWKEPERPYDVLWGQVYFVPQGNYPKGPDLSRLSPIGRIIAPELSISGGQGIPGLPGRRDMVTVRYQGYFPVDGAGIFAFRLVADNYAKLIIGQDEITEIIDGSKLGERGALGWAFLQQGNYPITVEYFHARGEPMLKLFVTEPEKKEQVFAPAQSLEGYASDSGKLSLIPAFVYFLKPGVNKLPNFNKISPAGMFFTKAIDYPLNRGTEYFPGVPQRDDWLGLRFYVKFSLTEEETGTYKFRIVCRDGARLIIGKKIVVNADGIGKVREESGEIALPAGSHEMFLDYFHTKGPNGLQLFITPPGGEEKVFAFN